MFSGIPAYFLHLSSALTYWRCKKKLNKFDNYFFLRNFSFTKIFFSTQKLVFHFGSHSPHELCVSFLRLNKAFLIWNYCFCNPFFSYFRLPFSIALCAVAVFVSDSVWIFYIFFKMLRFLSKKVKNCYKSFMHTCFHPDFVFFFCKLPITASV